MKPTIVFNKTTKTFTIAKGTQYITGWPSAQCAQMYLTLRNMDYSTSVAKSMAIKMWEESPLYADAIAEANKRERQAVISKISQQKTYEKAEVVETKEEEPVEEELVDEELKELEEQLKESMTK